MKTLLGCLMCLVFTVSQSLAISGGPFGGKSKVNTVGTYAGVLIPKTHVPCDSCTGEDTSLNQLGLFTVTIPSNGIGTGTALLFEEGNTWSGNIQANADPDSAKVSGIITASFSYIIIVTSTDSQGHTTQTPVTVAAIASGKVEAKAKASTQSFTFSSIRLTGNADIQFERTINNPFDEIIFKIVGFKQANS